MARASCLVGALSALAGCQQASRAETPPERAPVPVRIARLSPTSHPRVERRSARAEARREVRLAFGTPGRVQLVRPDEGDRVKKGALLAAVDTRALEAAVESAAAQLERAERELARAEQLRERKSVSAQMVDERRSQVRLAKAQRDAAEANLAQARIVAPFDADVVARLMEPGAWANPGMPALALAVLDPIRVVARVTDATRPYIEPGAEVQVRVEGEDRPRAGRVVRVAPVVDPQTGLLRVEMDVPNPDRRIAAGQPVDVALDLGAHQDVYVLEPEWVVYRYDGPAVVVVEDGRARTVPLGAGVARADEFFIVPQSNLPDLPIAVVGQNLVKEGGPVRVVGEGPDA